MTMTQDRGFEAAWKEQKNFERRCSLIAVLVMLATFWLVVVM
jgi:diacylglycerol kinase